MALRARLVIFSVFISLAFTAMPTQAASESHFEITPIVGYRFGGNFDAANGEVRSSVKLAEDVSYGLLLAWNVDKKRQGEFLLSHHNTEFDQFDNAITNKKLSITYMHVGGNLNISEGVVPLFVTGGLGLTHLSPDDSLLNDETRFSMNLGLMTKVDLSENISLRFGGRVYATFFNSDSHIFCNSDICTISITSDLWIQSEVNAGLTFTF
ncbi:MAG: outer membrane beta-barrel protein [Colwellia sp.]